MYFQKYVRHVWEGIAFVDYITIFSSIQMKRLINTKFTKNTKKKLKYKNNEELQTIICKIEKEKLLYFILVYKQKITLVKTGEKKKGKEFLGYEFSNRRGNEGIHPIQRGKMIDDCTKLYDAENPHNFERAKWLYSEAFENTKQTEIHESLKKNISRQDLVDMMTFDRADFEKTISLNVKKKIKSKWKLEVLGEICDVRDGTHDSPRFVDKGYPLVTSKNITNNVLS